ncbi:MAG: TM2 domain-containing protein [Pigmentiphaga sp.]|nr:TM2 domain-containing protein [Pigmentiphaga sp.]
MTPASPPSFRHKTLAAVLAFFLGWAGAHWWYLGRRLPWLPLLASVLILGFAFWRETPLTSQLGGYYLFLIPLVAGFTEAMVLCLIDDRRFDARYNRGQARQSNNGWLAVLLAIAFLLLGMSVIVSHVVTVALAMADGTLRL